MGDKYCVICGNLGFTTKHHLIPRYTWQLWKHGLVNKTVPLCVSCHRTIHSRYPNEILAERFNTSTKLITEFRNKEETKCLNQKMQVL